MRVFRGRSLGWILLAGLSASPVFAQANLEISMLMREDQNRVPAYQRNRSHVRTLSIHGAGLVPR
jgi:hypothetical protein